MSKVILVTIKRSYQEDLVFGAISPGNIQNFLKHYIDSIDDSYYVCSVDKNLNEGVVKVLAVEQKSDMKKKYSEKMCWVINFREMELNDYLVKLNPTDFEGRKLLKKLIY